MPTQNFTSRIGSSPSKVANSVLKNSAGKQMPIPLKSAPGAAFNKHPVSVGKK